MICIGLQVMRWSTISNSYVSKALLNDIKEVPSNFKYIKTSTCHNHQGSSHCGSSSINLELDIKSIYGTILRIGAINVIVFLRNWI